jgi:hypothetical protein
MVPGEGTSFMDGLAIPLAAPMSVIVSDFLTLPKPEFEPSSTWGGRILGHRVEPSNPLTKLTDQ